MLMSFIPVFMLSGREGKYFHPLAFTKSFAMIGVALLGNAMWRSMQWRIERRAAMPTVAS